MNLKFMDLDSYNQSRLTSANCRLAVFLFAEPGIIYCDELCRKTGAVVSGFQVAKIAVNNIEEDCLLSRLFLLDDFGVI